MKFQFLTIVNQSGILDPRYRSFPNLGPTENSPTLDCTKSHLATPRSIRATKNLKSTLLDEITLTYFFILQEHQRKLSRLIIRLLILPLQSTHKTFFTLLTHSPKIPLDGSISAVTVQPPAFDAVSSKTE